jgi:Spy/CpxP family protein refolding chaperone
METKAKSKWLVRAVAVGIFLLGFVAGGLALNGYRVWSRNGRQPADRRERFEQMMVKLNLNDDQKAQARQILGDTREKLQALRKESEPRVTDIRKDADDRLQKIMSPEQWKQFQQLRDEERNRGRGRGAGRNRER